MSSSNETSKMLYPKSIFGEDKKDFHLNEATHKRMPKQQKQRTISYCKHKKSLFSDSSDDEDDTTNSASSTKSEEILKRPNEFCLYHPHLFSR